MPRRIGLPIVFSLLVSCSDSSVIYQENSASPDAGPIALHEVRLVSETSDNLVVDFTYTYDGAVPVDEVKLFVMPDHGYWRTRDVTVSRGTHTARASMGLSRSNMEEDDVTESDTTMLRFSFEHYRPGEYVGNIWGTDVMYGKHWELK